MVHPCSPPTRDLIGLPSLLTGFPTAGALPEGSGRPVLGFRWVRCCASRLYGLVLGHVLPVWVRA